MGKPTRKRTYYVDFQDLESKNYDIMTSFEKEVVDKMIQMNQPQDLSMTERQEALYDMIDAAMAELTERQRQVIEYAFGLNGREKLSNAQIAVEMDISRQGAFNLKRRALDRLRKSTKLNEKVVKNLKNKSGASNERST